MTDTEAQENTVDTSEGESDNPGSFSLQPTGLVETTFAETLGLSMHNAIVNQQSSQMTTSASITNACARLLKTPISVKPSPEKEQKESKTDQNGTEMGNVESSKPTRRFKIGNFFKSKKNNDSTEVKDESRTDEQ